MTRREQFEKKCSLVLLRVGFGSVNFYEDSPTDPDNAFEDDGALHIRREGYRACFDVSSGQEDSAAEQNRKTRAILEAMNMRQWITPQVLVEDEDDEDSEDDGRCPHCNRDY